MVSIYPSFVNETNDSCFVKPELFLSLKDNYVENMNEAWMIDFRSMIETEFVYKLVDLNSPPTVQQVKDHCQ